MTMTPDTLTDRLERGDVMAAQCPSRALLRHVTSQWGVLVLTVLRRGTLRYSEIRHRIGGISEKMLAQTLRTLESDGFVSRTVHPVVPPHVDYRLTAAGQEVAGRIADLVDWIEGNLGMLLSPDTASLEG
ncbi:MULTISPECIES: winged helix-turn-helix transcriptional regulator [unclassified Zymobacter]|uniref:winged helix-turn-helix transcriptional regulator n=1 Tax=unclassified Zymobacter TaxID=3048685 RepID=UPI0039C0D752